MKKLTALLVASVMAIQFLTGCGGENIGKGAYEIALVTDKGNIDDKSFNQGAWEGVEAYGKANGMEPHYYKPEEASDEGYLKAIQLAVDGGAKVVVCPGYLFEVAVYNAQIMFPDVKFILLDGEPHTADGQYKTESNVACIKYAEEEAGFLAGYAALIEAVTDGKATLGFEGGMAVPAVVAFGYGYLQGIESAATELGLEDGAVKVFYHYTGDFAETDANKAIAKGMFESGATIVFGCGGSIGKSVFSAASEANGKSIGVDVDQKGDSETVITSAMKGLGASVQAVLKSYYAGTFEVDYGGRTTYFAAQNDGVSLSDDYERLEKFTKEQYNSIYTKLVDGTIDPVREFKVAAQNGIPTFEELKTNLKLVKVVVEIR